MVTGSGFGAFSLPQNHEAGQKEWGDAIILGFMDSYRSVEKMKGKLGGESRRV